MTDKKRSKTIWTYKDYCQLPPDRKRRIYQIIQGEMHMVPSPNSHHQKILFKILYQLGQIVEENDLGTILPAPMDVIFSETDVVQPDILFVAKGRENIIKKEGVFGAPDLVIEIQSPSTQKLDEVDKKELYESQGVREYILFYPEEKKALSYAREKGYFENRGMAMVPDPLDLHIMDYSLDLEKIFE